MSQNIVGQEHILERLLIGLLANGNLLVEGLPGLAKTCAVKSLIEFRTNRMPPPYERFPRTPQILL
jgi:MoxR-like ATPase